MLTRNELVMRATEVFQGVAVETLQLRIEHSYPLWQAGQAHRDLASRMTTGKVLLIPESRRSRRIVSTRIARPNRRG